MKPPKINQGWGQPRRTVKVLTRPTVKTDLVTRLRSWSIVNATVTSTVGLYEAFINSIPVRVETRYRGRLVRGWAFIVQLPAEGRKGFAFVGTGPLTPVRKPTGRQTP